MKTKSAWFRGLVYGGLFGGVIGTVTAVMAFSGGATWQEGLYATGVGASMWGCIGFFLGFAGLRERSAPGADLSVRSTPASIVKQWVYRVLGGLALGSLGATIAELMVLALFFGGLDGYLYRKHTPEEVRWHFLGFLAMLGAAAAAMAGGLMGVIVAPLRFESHSIIRISVMSSALAAVVGGWLSVCVGLLTPHALTFGQAVVWAVLAIGAATGIIVAIAVRIFASSQGSRTRSTSGSDDSAAAAKASETSIMRHDP